MNKWGRNLVILTMLLTPTASTVHAQTPQPIHVTVDGKVLQMDVAPIMVNQQVLVPLRTIADAVGGTITWNGKTSTATVTFDGESSSLTTGAKFAHNSGYTFILDVPARLVNGKLMVPLDFLTEGLGLQVQWDSKTSTVIIRDHTGQALTVKQIAQQNINRVVLINVYDEEDNKIATGSGFVIDSTGKILTNAHVIEGAGKVEIVFQDQTKHTSDQVLLYDKINDLALMQFDVSNLSPVKFGASSTLEIGDRVVAIGSPIGFQNTLSAGLVSGLNRKPFSFTKEEEEDMKDYLTEEEFEEYLQMRDLEFIQTNAQISPGSSGGALFNMQGEVIGVTAMAVSMMTGDLNFAIPSANVQNFLAQKATPQKLSDLIKKNPTEEEDQGNGSSDEDFDKKIEEMINLQTALEEDHSTYQIPGTDKEIDLNYYYVDFSHDEYNHDITVSLEGDYFSTSTHSIDREKTLAFLKELLKNIHTSGSKNPLVRIELEYETTEYNPNIPQSDQRYYPRTNKFDVNQFLAWGLLDDKTMTVTYQIDPYGNGKSETFQLQ